MSHKKHNRENNKENIHDSLCEENYDENEGIQEAEQELQQSENLLELKIKELEDQYLRTHADFENVKKRLEREKFQALEYAHEKIIKDILPIADTLEKALESARMIENGEKIAQGLSLTIDNLYKVFNKYGVEVINADAQTEFDPNLHDAIMQVADPDKKDGQIAQVLQNGYKYKERTLRPAMVSLVKNG